LEFPQQLVTQISIPNNVPFAPGYDVIGIGSALPQAMIDAGYVAAIVFYSGAWNPTATQALIKYQFIADKDGVIYFGYGFVENASVTQSESIVVYEAHGFGQTSSSTQADYNSTDYISATGGSIGDLAVLNTLRYKGAELANIV